MADFKHVWDKLTSAEFRRDVSRLTWGGLPQVAQNHNYLITGDQNYHWIDYLRDKYFENGNAGRTLALGCGEGYIERLLKERGFKFTSITGIDVSEKCVEAAATRAHECKLAPEIQYIPADLNEFKLSGNYNFIFFFHSLHHVEALEKLLSECAQALLPGGLMMVNEFVGPSRFQWTDAQLQAANAIFRLLPEELRFDLVADETRGEIARPKVEDMIRDDESEAVRSAEIEKVLKENFTILEEKNWGGTLTNLVFQNTAGNYNPQNPYHNTIVSLLIHHENVLIANGILPSDFKFYVVSYKKMV